MKGFNKIVAGILAATAVAAQGTVFASVLPDDVAGTRYEEPIQILSALKIMNGDEDGEFRPDDTIKRSEAAKMAIHALGLEDAAQAASGQSKYPDVPTWHWANGYINLATSQGIVIGNDDGNFRPDDKITYAEAMTIMVRTIGHGPAAEAKGGYPQGYIVVGAENNLNKNVTGSNMEPISRGNVAFMTANALTAKLMERKGFGEDESYEVTDKTLLYDKLGVTKAEGQITAIEKTGLNGASNLTAGQIQIGDQVFETAYNMNSLLGHNVTYYWQENDNGDNEVILALSQSQKNATVTIPADLFEGVTEKNGNTVLEYLKNEDDSRVSSVTLSADAKLIYNGKAETMDTDLINMKDKSGKVVVLDSDRDGKYDIVYVMEYENMVVEEVTATNKIVDKYGAPTLNLGEDEDVRYTITSGFNQLTPQDLKEYDVLSVAASKDKELYEINVSNKTVEGKVTGKDSKGFYIAGEHYKVAPNYQETIEIGAEGLFYLDIDNRIAAVDKSVAVSRNYAYLIKAHTSADTEESTFKMFTKDGKEETFTANEKIRFNKQSGKKAEDVVNSLQSEGATVKQLVTYTLNADGKLTTLNTAADNTQTGAVDTNNFTKNYDLTDAVYNEKLQKLGKVNLTEETIIFDIQNDSTDYSIATLEMFEDGQKYNAIVFDVAEDFTAKAIVVTNAQFQTNADSSIAVVDKISTAANEDDEITDRLHAYQDGKAIEINAEEQGILTKGEGQELETGDIIQYKTNAKGEIVNIRVLFDIQTKGTEGSAEPVENLTTMYGKVTKKFASSINVTVNDGEVINVKLPAETLVYSVDTTKSKNQVTTATIGDIQAFEADEGNRVFIKFYKDVVQEVVIIK